MSKPDPDYDKLTPAQITKQKAEIDNVNEIDAVVLAANALELDAPIIHYRILGDRIELWTIHGGPYVYQPVIASEAKQSAPKKPIRKKK